MKPSDIVYTPIEIAKEIIDRYKPTGKILDPCAGKGAFRDQIPNCLWCEIAEGKDFFTFNESVDWIISNPPYSIFNEWLNHSYDIADNIVYLIPLAKILTSRNRFLALKNYGGIVEIYAPWTGYQIGFDFGWLTGAVYLKRNYTGDTKIESC